MIAAHLHYVINTVVAVVSMAFGNQVNNLRRNAFKEDITGCLFFCMNVLYVKTRNCG